MCEKKKYIALLAFTIIALSGCQDKARQNKYSVYRMPLIDKIQTLNPRKLRIMYDDEIAKSIYGQLIGVDRDGYLVPRVCYKWDVSSDLREYIFYLRKDVLFHDGTPLTAKDILFSFEYEGGNPTLLHKIFLPIEGYEDYYNGIVDKIRGVELIDDYTIKIKLTKSIATFLYTLGNSKIIILPFNFHGIPEDEFFKRPIGVGPYKIERWNDNELSMVVNDKYFGRKGQIDRFVFKVMDKEQAIEAFEKHEVDDLVIYKIRPADIVRTDVKNEKITSFGTHFLFFNVKKAPLDNVNLRLAIRAAIDKEKLITKCYPDDEVANGVIPKGLVGSIDDPHAFDDLNKSVDYYLAKAGLTRKQIPKMKLIRFTEVQDDCFKPTIEDMFRNAGFPIEVVYVTFEDGIEKVERNDYYMLSEWIAARNVEPISILNFFDGRSRHNLSNMNDNEINKLIDIAELARTRSARGEIYRQISEMIVSRAYVVDMQYENRHYIYDKRVKGIENMSPMMNFVGFDDFSFAER